MFRKLRHILMIAQAMLVMVMSVQSVLNTSHHYAPPATVAQVADETQAEALLAFEERLSAGESEDASTPQHEHESTVDHAMIGPAAGPQLPPLRSVSGAVPASNALPPGYAVTTPDRPPRQALAA